MSKEGSIVTMQVAKNMRNGMMVKSKTDLQAPNKFTSLQV